MVGLRHSDGTRPARSRARPPGAGFERASDVVIDCDAVIPAIGQKMNVAWFEGEPGLELTSKNTFKVNPNTFQTGIPDVFVAGDAVTGPARQSKLLRGRVVAAIHRYICGEDLNLYAKETAAGKTPGSDWMEIPESH